MKPVLSAVIFLGAVLGASATLANADPSVTPHAETRQIGGSLSDPQDFASDICWVAPEWRND